VSPLGVVFAARIDHPTGLRADLLADTSWECRGLEWQVGETGAAQDWWAALAIPWTAFSAGPQPAAAAGGRRWRANFYRVERPRRGRAEFSCWSPTLTEPPDFHRPARFGRLELQVAPQPEA
jgi:cellulose/xylan binding protein with CBM9 domain